MQKLRCDISTGDRVHVRGEAWLVVQRETFDNCALVTLGGAGDANLGETTRLLAPFDRILRSHVPAGIARAPRPRVLQHVAEAVARAYGWCDSWTAGAASIDLLPWQLEPAHAAVCGATRLLLADEVGLGKTIQAGLLLTELRARGLMSRALILTPASLRDQWASELGDRFGLEPRVVDHSALARLVSELPVGVNPWGISDLVISSIDLVKRPEVRVAIDAVPFDAVVVDEAHHLKPGTDRGAVVADLATRIPWVVLATATPHSGDEDAFAFLGRLGAAGSEDELRVFRRSACDVGRPRPRVQRFCPVTPTSCERALLEQTLAYARAVWRRQSAGASHAAIVASVLCRRAVSSARAVLRTLERRRVLLGGAGGPEAVQAQLPWFEGDDADDVESDDVLSIAGLPDRGHELACLDRLIEAARSAAAGSSKASVIERLLHRTREPLLVFSEYRDTISDLEARVGGLATVTLLHGGMSAGERRESVRRFAGGGARVLLATDAAGEGLNLQARCRVVVNVELPWNPLRLEQRIGRVDRLGQTRRVHALSLFHRGSFEDEVLARLQQRIRNIAAAVLDGEAPLEAVPEVRLDTASSSGDELAAAATLRRRAASLANGAPPRSISREAVCAEPARRRRLVDGVVLLFECHVHDERGRLVARELLPLEVRVQPALALPRGAMRHVCRILAASPIVQDTVRDEMHARANVTRAATRRTARAVAERLEALLARAEPARPALFQASLFDRRAEQQARASDAAMAVAREHLHHRLADVGALAELDETFQPRLVAAWPVGPE